MASYPRTSTDSSAPSAHLAPTARARRAQAAPLPRVAGRVLDDRARPIAGAGVTLAEVGDHHAGPPAGASRTTTDADGRFQLASPRGGAALLLVRADGWLPEVLLASRRTRDVVLRLARGGALRGTVADALGAPVAGLEIHATSREAVDASSAVTGADGRFALDGLRAGAWRVSAGARHAEVEVRPGDVAEVVLTLDDAA